MMIASAVINQNAALHCHAMRSNSFLGLASSSPKKVKKVLYGINTAEPVHFIRLLDFKEKSLKLKAAISDTDILKGTDLASSLLYTEHPTILNSENNDEGSKFSDEEVLSSVQLCTKQDVSQTVGRLAIVESLLDKLKAVQLHVLASERWNASQLKLCHRQYLVSATNLIHHLALRRLDVGQLKEDLSSIGLLNLENVDSCVLPSLTAIIQLLENLKSPGSKEVVHSDISSEKESDQHTFKHFPVQTMRKKATSNKNVFFGPLSDGRTTHIMVTVGQEVTLNETSVADLIQAGASIVRINCAHGSPSVWSEIIKRVKESSQMVERPCRILMDLAGEKFRTGQLKPGPDVMKISPKKNDCGELIFPAQVWLSHKGAGSPPAHLSPDAILIVDGQKFLIGLEVGDNISFCDARGKMRSLKITRSFHVFSGTGYVAECTRTAYIKAGTELNKKRKKGRSLVGKVVDVPAAEPFVRLRVGDLVTISRDGSSNQDEFSHSTHSAQRITCSSGYLFDSVKPGERIAFDDGKIWGIIKGTSMSEIVVSITHASPRGTKLGSNKSINIPDSNVRFEGFTSKDLMDLEYVAAHADMVGVSFVRDVRDIVVLRQELEKRRLRDLGIVLKIETNSGFEKLPMMLLEAMKCSNPLCVMIARGDLAVECGWERLGHMQEEILSICGAAHIPVIWATQVLESLVKSGVPTRAEITDAACGRRASCVMLNKGKHVIEAVSTLNNILRADLKKMKPTN